MATNSKSVRRFSGEGAVTKMLLYPSASAPATAKPSACRAKRALAPQHARPLTSARAKLSSSCRAEMGLPPWYIELPWLVPVRADSSA